MIWMWVSGMFFGLMIGVILWYPYKNKANVLSDHCETLQYCLDMCADYVEDLQSSARKVSQDK